MSENRLPQQDFRRGRRDSGTPENWENAAISWCPGLKASEGGVGKQSIYKARRAPYAGSIRSKNLLRETERVKVELILAFVF